MLHELPPSAKISRRKRQLMFTPVGLKEGHHIECCILNDRKRCISDVRSQTTATLQKRGCLVVKKQSIIILLAPSEWAYQKRPIIPPLSLGILHGYLAGKGIATQIYDLNSVIRVQSGKIPLYAWGFIYDIKRVENYLRGVQDKEIDDVLDMVLSDIDFSNSLLVALSLGADFSWLEMHGGAMLAKRIRTRYHVQTVLGGNNVNYLLQFRNDFASLWKAMLSSTSFICVGPGERMIESLYYMLEKHDVNIDTYRVLPGAVWEEGNELAFNTQDSPTLTIPDFTGLELSEYTLCLNSSPSSDAQKLNETFFLKWHDPYPLIASNSNRVRLPIDEQVETLFIPYIFSYNCPFRCAFCEQSGRDKRYVSPKPAESILDDIEFLMQKYNSRYFYFLNNTFNRSREFVRDFCDGVKRRALTFYWSDCARFDNLDYELLKMIRESGCCKLMFGLESGSEKIQKLINKQLDISHAQQVLRWCKELGIWADIEVIVGFPFEFEDDFRQTVQFIQDNRSFINHFALNRFFVVPNSLFGMHPADYGIRLVRVRNCYQTMLMKNYERYVDGVDRGFVAMNFQVFRFSEINGRSHEVITAETEDKVRRLNSEYQNLDIVQEVKLLGLVK